MAVETNQEAAVRVDVELKKTLEDCFTSQSDMVQTVPYITTITVCFTMDQEEIEVSKLIEVYNKTKQGEEVNMQYIKGFVDTVFGGFDNLTISIPRYNRKNFLNCAIFKLKETNGGLLAIKCFTNGTIHITGAKTLERALEVAESFSVYYELVYGGDGLSNAFPIVSFEIQMVNAHFAFDVKEGSFELDALFNLLLKETEHRSMYNNERHAGVIIQMMMESMKKVSIILFDSGNVLICAFCNGNDFAEAFKFITLFIQKHWSLIWTPYKKDKTTATKEKSVSRKRGHFDYGSYLVLK